MANKAHVDVHRLSTDKEQEWILARKGISLLINNNYEESQALFLEYPNSLVMYAGYSFTIFMVISIVKLINVYLISVTLGCFNEF